MKNKKELIDNLRENEGKSLTWLSATLCGSAQSGVDSIDWRNEIVHYSWDNDIAEDTHFDEYISSSYMGFDDIVWVFNNQSTFRKYGLPKFKKESDAAYVSKPYIYNEEIEEEIIHSAVNEYWKSIFPFSKADNVNIDITEEEILSDVEDGLKTRYEMNKEDIDNEWVGTSEMVKEVRRRLISKVVNEWLAKGLLYIEDIKHKR